MAISNELHSSQFVSVDLKGQHDEARNLVAQAKHVNSQAQQLLSHYEALLQKFGYQDDPSALRNKRNEILRDVNKDRHGVPAEFSAQRRDVVSVAVEQQLNHQAKVALLGEFVKANLHAIADQVTSEQLQFWHELNEIYVEVFQNMGELALCYSKLGLLKSEQKAEWDAGFNSLMNEKRAASQILLQMVHLYPRPMQKLYSDYEEQVIRIDELKLSLSVATRNFAERLLLVYRVAGLIDANDDLSSAREKISALRAEDIADLSQHVIAELAKLKHEQDELFAQIQAWQTQAQAVGVPGKRLSDPIVAQQKQIANIIHEQTQLLNNAVAAEVVPLARKYKRLSRTAGTLFGLGLTFVGAAAAVYSLKAAAVMTVATTLGVSLNVAVLPFVALGLVIAGGLAIASSMGFNYKSFKDTFRKLFPRKSKAPAAAKQAAAEPEPEVKSRRSSYADMLSQLPAAEVDVAKDNDIEQEAKPAEKKSVAPAPMPMPEDAAEPRFSPSM